MALTLNQKSPSASVKKRKKNMKKLKMAVCGIGLAAAMTASAQITYSGTALSGLDFSTSGLASGQYVPALGSTPALAELSTPDSGITGSSGAAVVYIPGPTAAGTFSGTLSSFVASYDLYGAATGPSGTSPFWVLWMADDTGFNYPIVADGGSILNSSSLIHVGDLIHGSITLATLCGETDPISGLLYGGESVAWAGVQIGGWNNNGIVVPASADFDSFTVPGTPVPEPTTMISGAMLLLPFGSSAFRQLRRKFQT
jgi:hypothetical protein